MTRDDVIRLYKEANGWSPEEFDRTVQELERFAALVAAPLQERIQLLYEQLNEAEKQLDAQYKLGMEAEREACAAMWDAEDCLFEGPNIAHVIRARGNA